MAAWILSSCTGASVEVFEQCTVEVRLSDDRATPGTSIVATGGPFGEAYDNVVQVDGVRAEVESTDQQPVTDTGGAPLDPLACESCDQCRTRNAGHCNRCKTQCASCVETLTFVVPVKDAGPGSVVVMNAFGGSEPVPFTVDALPDTGSTGGTGLGGTGLGGTGSPTSTGTTGILPTDTAPPAGTGITADTTVIDTTDTASATTPGGTGGP